MTTIAEFHNSEIENILIAIKTENWAYTNRNLPRLSHEEQFYILDNIPVGILEDVHHFLFEQVQYAQKTLHETQYSSDMAVTILRKKGVYSDVQDDESSEKIKTITEYIKGIWV